MSPLSQKTVRRFFYDPLDRFVSTNATLLFYNQTRLATEVEDERSNRLFEYDAQPLALQQNGTTCTLLATDMQTSVLQSVRTDGPQQALAYTPYGHQKDLKTLTGVCGFNGERPDPLTGHYLLGQGYRAFNPVLMRFNSPDNLSPFAEGGINAYAYCGGDPLNRVDPTGHFFSKINRLIDIGIIKVRAALTGGHVKKVHKLTRLSEGIIAFEDTYKNMPRMNFSGHGKSSEGSARLMFKESQSIDARSLVNLAANNGIDVKNYNYLRIIMCHSANGDSRSFGATLHTITGRPVKSYRGTVSTTNPELLVPKLKIGETSTKSSIIHTLKNKNLWRYLFKGLKENYQPVTFGTAIRTA
ncbi:RHS repeat-associated core domain-containing protein [Pseudomonas saxonica]|uniref:RHS repeat-associated core domain-containing protein n=1 Tax=Pseudomonas saxonica TaxID=2600598 RepID=A0A5C5Q8T7_9PSED|nr:RHS repeat-associated core domain-containing protein [Pseudomonas saxonica]TWS00151.1 RHS repeat-associated core domain-containing protein [Pseudomonas saxonica]